MKVDQRPAFAAEHQKGMTRRELYAGLAMQGLIAAQSRWPDFATQGRIATYAVAQADQLIAELDKE